jgi:hypothetical protein
MNDTDFTEFTLDVSLVDAGRGSEVRRDARHKTRGQQVHHETDPNRRRSGRGRDRARHDCTRTLAQH